MPYVRFYVHFSFYVIFARQNTFLHTAFLRAEIKVIRTYNYSCQVFYKYAHKIIHAYISK